VSHKLLKIANQVSMLCENVLIYYPITFYLIKLFISLIIIYSVSRVVWEDLYIYCKSSGSISVDTTTTPLISTHYTSIVPTYYSIVHTYIKS